MAEPGVVGARAVRPFPILTDYLTLSQPWGADCLCPPYYYLPPQIFRPSIIPSIGIPKKRVSRKILKFGNPESRNLRESRKSESAETIQERKLYEEIQYFLETFVLFTRLKK